MDATGFWDEFKTDWACLDCELMPWSAKAQELLRSQYAAVGAAGRASLPKAVAALRQAAERSAQRTADLADAADAAGYATSENRRDGHRAVRQRLPPLLLAGELAGRPEAGALPPAGHRGQGPRRPGPRLAHGDAGRDLPPRPGAAAGHAVQGGRCDRPGQPATGHRLVAGADRPRRRRHGRQAARVHRQGHRRASCSRP